MTEPPNRWPNWGIAFASTMTGQVGLVLGVFGGLKLIGFRLVQLPSCSSAAFQQPAPTTTEQTVAQSDVPEIGFGDERGNLESPGADPDQADVPDKGPSADVDEVPDDFFG